MSDTIEKHFLETFAAAWNEAAPAAFKTRSELSLLSLREALGEQVESALAVAATWPAAFSFSLQGQLGGAALFMLKEQDCQEFERLAGRPTDGQPQSGLRAMLGAVLENVSARFSAELSAKLVCGEVEFLDLTADTTRLGAIVGDAVWVGTCSLTLQSFETQALVLYAPHGSVEILTPVLTPVMSAAAAETRGGVDSAHASPPPARPEVPATRNIERLLEVELDVVVRFGVTNVPLRDVVRMGVGTMIELNRAVDEPVELLVNGRHLARGEVVVVDGYYGVRITEIGSASERALSLS